MDNWHVIAFAVGKVIGRCSCKIYKQLVLQDFGIYNQKLLDVVNIIQKKLNITIDKEHFQKWVTLEDTLNTLNEITKK